MSVIVTGAAGYIGSHIATALLEMGEEVVGLDDLSTGRLDFVDPRIDFRQVDITQFDELYSHLLHLKGSNNLAVIHAAGIKFAGESVKKPLEFYNTNFTGTLNILKVMDLIEARDLVFSSSCSVYGNIADGVGVTENQTPAPISPYGRSKYFSELAIQDMAATGKIKAVSLRYFNVAGNGETHSYDLSPFNLFPNLFRAIQNNEPIQIFGNVFQTRDGSCVRDYVDVTDLAKAHTTALNLLRKNQPLKLAYNLGSGEGATVLEIVESARRHIASNLESKIVMARAGDPGSILADISSAKNDLGWMHNKTIDDMLISGWNAWQKYN
jgi:UDP-glucose 4-epimerase